MPLSNVPNPRMLNVSVQGSSLTVRAVISPLQGLIKESPSMTPPLRVAAAHQAGSSSLSAVTLSNFIWANQGYNNYVYMINIMH